MEKDAKVAAEDPKVDLFEDDDEFEEFEINEGFFFFFFFKFLFLIVVQLLLSLYTTSLYALCCFSLVLVFFQIFKIFYLL